MSSLYFEKFYNNYFQVGRAPFFKVRLSPEVYLIISKHLTFWLVFLGLTYLPYFFCAQIAHCQHPKTSLPLEFLKKDTRTELSKSFSLSFDHSFGKGRKKMKEEQKKDYNFLPILLVAHYDRNYKILSIKYQAFFNFQGSEIWIQCAGA